MNENSTRLRQIIESYLHSLLPNASYNFSYTELKTLLKMVNRNETAFEWNDSAPISISKECGGSLESIVTEYTRHYHPYFSIFVCLFGTVANVLNIAVLTRKDMACAPINRILTALAVADVLLMIEYIPYAYYYYLVLLDRRDFPYGGAVFMLFHTHYSQVLHTVSICLTLTLAIWRYLAIGYPDRNHYLCSESRCTLAIFLSYSLPIILCAPTYTTTTIKSTEIVEDGQMFTLYVLDLSDMIKNDNLLLGIHFWIYAVFIKLLPCCILTVISSWLIRTLFLAKRRKQVLRGYDSYLIASSTANGKDVRRKATKVERRAERTTKMLIAVVFLFLITEFPQGIFALLVAMKGQYFYASCYQIYGEIMDILALINGAINFILYCCMNRMFRATFGQLFKHKILARWAAGTPSEIQTTTYV